LTIKLLNSITEKLSRLNNEETLLVAAHRQGGSGFVKGLRSLTESFGVAPGEES
jgi:hypothetical protein